MTSVLICGTIRHFFLSYYYGKISGPFSGLAVVEALLFKVRSGSPANTVIGIRNADESMALTLLLLFQILRPKSIIECVFYQLSPYPVPVFVASSRNVVEILEKFEVFKQIWESNIYKLFSIFYFFTKMFKFFLFEIPVFRDFSAYFFPAICNLVPVPIFWGGFVWWWTNFL